MDLRDILTSLLKGKITIVEAEKLIKLTSIEKIDEIAKFDINRYKRKGIPEIVLGEGKNLDDLNRIIVKVLEKAHRIILCRLTDEQLEFIPKNIQDDIIIEVNRKAKMLVIKKKDFTIKKTGGKVGILAAGTSDIPVGEEARVIAEEMGCTVTVAYDVGVAGLHRALTSLREMIQKDVDVLIVVAGREGALPSVVTGLVDIPVIGVPTSIGYGLGKNGISALISMLQACPLGLAVVNIDGGVPAGAMAALIANRMAKARME